ncbi:MAG: hypothetical protein M1168_02115 [Candidatus Marsarchaeota archaeon]|nr:hypothetical protein [Candidatus Marsarchaeota archaeon]MCL5094755.1 hypothetical protein [Candidatus Marsarchaeota archaeon]
MILLFILISFILFSIGISGIAFSRHFILMIISVEIIFVASSLLAVSFFTYLILGNIILLLLAIWSVAAIEIITLIIFYRYMSKVKVSLDVSKLSKLKN